VVVNLGFVKLFSAVCLAGSVCLISLLALLLVRGNVPFSTAYIYVAVLGGAAGGLLYLGVDAILTFGRGSSSLVLVRRGGRVISLKVGEGVVRRGVEGLRAERFGVLGLLKAAAVAAAFLEGYLLVALAFDTLTPFMVVPSTSMVPTLNVGDLIIVRGVDAAKIQPGDIIVFHVPPPYNGYTPSPIVHRVIGVRVENGRLFFLTRGDNSPSPDGWLVPAENVVGVCVLRVPYIGYPALFIRTPYGIVVLAAVILLMLFLPRMRR